MKKELLFIWINQDDHECFHPMAFNFSPEYDIHFDLDNRTLIAIKKDGINVFKSNNLLNLSAVIGENGTGKTTLLQYLTSLSSSPIQEPSRDEYYDHRVQQNEKKKFIAVYLENNNTLKVLNITDAPITFEGSEVAPYTCDDFINENYTSKISHIYLSNSEYTENRNLRSAAIDYITLTNDAIQSVFETFYRRLFHLSDTGVIRDNEFNALQSILLKRMSRQQTQMILDIVYQNYIASNHKVFCGKRINNISFSVASVCKLIPNGDQTLNYQTKFASKEHLNKVYAKVDQEVAKMQREKPIVSTCLINLVFELTYSFDQFNLCGESLLCNEVYTQCKKFVNEIPDTTSKSYYADIFEELDYFFSICDSANVKDNGLPEGDLARRVYIETDITSIYKLIELILQRGSSFLIKYLKVFDLEMSSGERALMNFMSRVLFASLIDKFMPESQFKLQDNVLLLIDEIDLYLHPEWQRRIIFELIDAVNNQFPYKTFQIIISSHSPIVLSDIPSANTTYLIRENGVIAQHKDKTQTFGANIHTLYKDAFFIKNGLTMGEYAQTYVNNIIHDIRSKDFDQENIKNRIVMIGEPVIRKKLLQLINEPNPSVKVDTSERKQIIDFLKKQKVEIERQIAILKGEGRYD